MASDIASDDAIPNASPGKTRPQPGDVAAVDRLAFGLGKRNLGEPGDILFERVIRVVAAEKHPARPPASSYPTVAANTRA
jgi:hypothetical protein